MSNFAVRAEELSTFGSRKIIGVCLEHVLGSVSDMAVLYADVGKRFNLEGFQKKGGYCLDVGIAEQSLIGVAAGLCHEGIRPIAISYAPFIVGRAFDQIKFAIGEMKLPIILVGAPSGLSSGGLGSLSVCVDDMAILRTIPNLSIVSPADGVEAIKCFEAAMKVQKPFYIRMTGGKNLPSVYNEEYDFEIGHAVSLREGRRVLVITTGTVTSQVLDAVDILQSEGNPVAVLNMHTVKPLDTVLLDRYKEFETFVTVEEHSIYGGLGGAVAEYLAGKKNYPKLVRLGTPDYYFASDHYENLLAEAGLSTNQIYETLNGLMQ